MPFTVGRPSKPSAAATKRNVAARARAMAHPKSAGPWVQTPDIRNQQSRSKGIIKPDSRTSRRASPDPELIVDSIITLDQSGIIQSASASVEQLFGWTPMDLLGRNVKVLIPEPTRSDLDRYLDRYRHADKAKSLERTRLVDAVRKDGSPIQIELSMSRADLPNHGIAYFIGIIRDVSRQIELSADGVDERTRLQRLLVEQTRALATANLRLQLADRLASLGTLAAGLGHDMNNVLLPVRARLTALAHAGINDAALIHVEAVQRSIAYLQQLSESLHFLAMDPESERAGLDGDGTTDIAYWWRHAGILLRTALPKRIRLVISIPTNLPAVRVAPHWLTQAMLNLLVNAGEAMPARRVNARVRVWAELSPDGTMVRLSVTDNGRGMTPKIKRRALDLFFTTKPRMMGTGLGLPLAQKVALRAGGDLEIRSVPGKGTTIALVMPAAKDALMVISETAPVQNRTAAVSLRDERTSALVAQLLAKAGLTLSPTKDGNPGTGNIWVTDPTRQSLSTATAWKARDASRVLVVVGLPAKRERAAWLAAGARIIDHPDDFESIRHTISLALLDTTTDTIAATGKTVTTKGTP
jgi:PAS domain S-box-containing protein